MKNFALGKMLFRGSHTTPSRRAHNAGDVGSHGGRDSLQPSTALPQCANLSMLSFEKIHRRMVETFVRHVQILDFKYRSIRMKLVKSTSSILRLGKYEVWKVSLQTSFWRLD